MMRPYRRSDKKKLHDLRLASPLGRLRLFVSEFLDDVVSLWVYGAPFPTFLKLLGSIFLLLLVLLPIVYLLFVAVYIYCTFEGLVLNVLDVDAETFHPRWILARIGSFVGAGRKLRPARARELCRVLTRVILVAHSLTTAVDYLCVMQGLLDDV